MYLKVSEVKVLLHAELPLPEWHTVIYITALLLLKVDIIIYSILQTVAQ